jgi:hypothetical protein
MQKKNEESPEIPWLKAFGALKELHPETKRVECVIEEEFERIDEEEWRPINPETNYE